MELEHFDIVSRCMGQTLTPQERSNLEIGILKRRATEALLSLRFWGRLIGEIQDYLIVAALLPGKEYPKKKFYFCTNSSPELQQFPQVSKQRLEMASKLMTRLKGDPAFLIGGDEPPNNNPEEGEATPFTELDRLVYMVEEIDRATAIVPLEAFVVSPMRQVVANTSFHGLKWDEAMHLHNYFHFREPELPERARTISMSDGLVRAGDFLDPLIHDLDGVWSITKDNTGSFVTLRNYLYPGTFFYHQPSTSLYGCVYFGDGRKNPDIAFMI